MSFCECVLLIFVRPVASCPWQRAILVWPPLFVGLPGQTADDDYILETAGAAGPDGVIFVPFTPMPNTPFAENKSALLSLDDNIERARRLTSRFYQRSDVRQRLHDATGRAGIRALMAQATLNRHLLHTV